MQDSSVNLPTLEGCTELILRATGLKFEYAKYKNLSPVAHDISSVGAPKGGKFTEDSCMEISFLRLPSHICLSMSFVNLLMKLSESYNCTAMQRQQDHIITAVELPGKGRRGIIVSDE